MTSEKDGIAQESVKWSRYVLKLTLVSVSLPQDWMDPLTFYPTAILQAACPATPLAHAFPQFTSVIVPEEISPSTNVAWLVHLMTPKKLASIYDGVKLL